MDKLLNDRMLFTAVILLKFLGEDKRASKKLIIFRTANIIALVLTGTFIVTNFYYVSGDTFIKALQSLMAVTHMLLKYIILIYYKHGLTMLLHDSTGRFWNYRKFPQHIKIPIEKIIQTVKYSQITILIVSLIVAYIYFLRPIFDVEYSFLLETRIPASYPMNAVLLWSQFYCFCIGIPITFSCDLIYLALCVHVVLQMRLLKYKIKETLKCGLDNSERILEGCINYHQFLQSIFSRMKQVYSITLLFHYFVTLISTCSDLYEVLVWNSDLTNTLIKFSSVVIFFAQFGYYTFPAEQVTFEFADLSDAIYLSRWYNNRLKLQKIVLLVMIRSQRLEFFTGAGLMNINVDTFGSVFKKTLSFYAVLRNLLYK